MAGELSWSSTSFPVKVERDAQVFGIDDPYEVGNLKLVKVIFDVAVN